MSGRKERPDIVDDEDDDKDDKKSRRCRHEKDDRSKGNQQRRSRIGFVISRAQRLKTRCTEEPLNEASTNKGIPPTTTDF